MNLGTDGQDKRHRNAIIIAVVSCVVLLGIALGGSIMLFRGVQSMQSSDYDSIPVGHMFSQAFGLESKNVKDVPENTRIFQRGCNYFLKGVMSDSHSKKEEAISFYLEALDQFKQYPGWNNTYAYDTMNRLATDYEELHQLKDAETWFKRQIDCGAAMSNKKHRIVAQAYQQLGEFYGRHWRYKDSINALQSALDIDLAGGGPKADRVGYDYWWLGSEQDSNNESAHALESFKKAANIGKNKWKHIELGEVALYETRCAYDLSDKAQARQFDDQAIEEFGTHDDIYDYYSARLWKATLLRDAGKIAEANDLLKQSLPSKEKVQANSKELGPLRQEFAEYFMDGSNYTMAEQLLREQVAHNEAVGNDDSHNRGALLSLARCLAKEKKMAESGKLYAQVISTYKSADKQPSKYLLTAAIKVFQASNMTDQLKSAQADLSKITSTHKQDRDDDDDE